jgi:hypothetical protein
LLAERREALQNIRSRDPFQEPGFRNQGNSLKYSLLLVVFMYFVFPWFLEPDTWNGSRVLRKPKARKASLRFSKPQDGNSGRTELIK